MEKSTNTATASSSGIGLTGILGVVFVVLKLQGTITWSWWWVTLPFWGPAVGIIAILLLILTIAFFAVDKIAQKHY